MFRFLKDRLKGAIKNFSRKTEEELLKEAAEEEKELQEESGEEEKQPAEESAEREKESPEEFSQDEKRPQEEPATKEKELPERPEEEGKETPDESAEEEKFASEVERIEKTLEERESPEKKPQGENTSQAENEKPAEEKTEKESSADSALAEIKSELELKKTEIRNEEDEKRGIIGRLADALKGKDGQEGNVLKRLAQVITTKRISEDKFDRLFEELEIALLENNVAVEVIDKIRVDLKANMVNKPIQGKSIEEAVTSSLKESIEQLFDAEKLDLMELVKSKKPYTIMFAGINGSGKTTTIAKIASRLQKNGLKCVVAASDTFRAAAIQQMQEHTDRLGIKLIKHDYGADPAAVAFDAKKYAEAKNVDVVLIDTAGRQHSNANLIDELKKIARVAKPDFKIFVGESIAGNDCVNQASKFNEAIGIDGIVLAKADVDEKGGAAISVSYVTRKPIIYLGTGQEYEDLTEFNPRMVVDSLGLAAEELR